MARINVEQAIFTDSRFINLCVRLGGLEPALGALIRVWIEGQKHYLKLGEIPNEEWAKQSLNSAVISCGLAEQTSTGVRIKGQDEQFGWLKNKSKAGKKSAKERKKKNGNSQPHLNSSQQVLNSSQQVFENPPNSCQQSSTSSSISSSVSVSDKEIHTCDFGFFDIIEIWNANCGSLPKASKPTKKRNLLFQKRIKEHRTKHVWVEAIKKIALSDFCNGRSKGSTGWVATIDWLLQPDSMVKVLEGKYDNREKVSKTSGDFVRNTNPNDEIKNIFEEVTK